MPPHHTDLHAELEQALGRTLDRAVVKSGRNTELRAQIDAMALCAGIVDRLDEAKQCGLKVGVASGSPREWVVGHLTKRGLVDRFEVIICCEDTAEHKPKPGPFLAVAERLKVDPADCLVLEDSPNGIRSAHLAGMKAVAVPNPLTRTMKFPGADLVVDSLSETTLAELAARLWADEPDAA